MDLKQVVMLAIQVSILSTVFGFGLKATREDLLYLLRQPRLLARSLLAVFVILPIVAVTLVAAFNFPQSVKIVLVALALSPVPPLLPRKETGAGGHGSYALGLMAILSLVSIVAVPLGLEFLRRVSGREMGMPPGTVAGVVVKGTILPLLAGMAVRAFLPAFAERIMQPVALIARLLLPAAVIVLFAGAATSIWALVGDGTVLSMVILTLAGLAIGHVLGRPHPEHSVVLALSTACRHPALALTIATTNFPDRQFGAIILMYLIVSGIVCLPYLKWHQRRRHVAAADVAHAH
jgi:bile acid:Na+ symporter, BASS family